MLRKLSFNNPKRGRQPRAGILRRAGRMLKRKRVAYARFSAAHAMKVAQMEADRFQKLAKFWDVPIDAMGPMPIIPELPNQKWVEHLQAIGKLTPAVNAASAQLRT